MRPLTRRSFGIASLATIANVAATRAGAQPLAQADSFVSGPSIGAPVPLGMRLVWIGGSASIPGSYSQIVPDHNGNWIDRNTGRPFSVSNIPSASGMGFLVGDVVAASASDMLLQHTTLLADPNGSGATSITGAQGMLVGRQGAADLWMPPRELAAMAERNEPNFRVLRTELVIRERRYRAIRIQTSTGNGWIQHAFDLGTGLALSMSSTLQGSPVMRLDTSRGTVSPGAGSVQLVHAQFVGSRPTQLPLAGAGFPAAVRSLRSMTFAASSRTEMAGIPPMAPTPLGQVQYQITANRGTYLEAVVRTPTASENAIFVAGAVGSPWMDPSGLVHYREGQVIDRDPVTGLQIAAAGRQGSIAIMTAQTGLSHNAFGYDLRNGLLSHVVSRTQAGQAAVFNRLVDAR